MESLGRIDVGMFDIVWVPCPKCGERYEFQAKYWDATCSQYTLETAPAAALVELYPDIATCKKCKKQFAVKVTAQGTVIDMGDRP